MTKTYEEKANELGKNCDNIIKNINNIECNGTKVTIKSFQYANVIYWYRVLFKKPLVHINGKTIIGFHIMPYQITANDIKNAVKNNNENFNEIISENINYIDFDSTTCNFHKVPNNKYQIVLIDQYSYIKFNHNGPGRPTSFIGNIDCFKINKSLNNYNKIEKYIYSARKDNMYFPNLLDEEIDNVDLNKLISEALAYLKEK